MPRLRDRSVLAGGLRELPLLWINDAFALALGYDDEKGRYAGLWTPDDNTPPPATTDALLLVRPEDALQQRDTEAPESPTSPDSPDESGPGPTPRPPRPDFAYPTRFFAVKTLNPDKIALDFRNLSDEVLAHLRTQNTTLTVRIEIEATDPDGFDEGKVRTVSENARTLKFDQSGFEER